MFQCCIWLIIKMSYPLIGLDHCLVALLLVILFLWNNRSCGRWRRCRRNLDNRGTKWKWVMSKIWLNACTYSGLGHNMRPVIFIKLIQFVNFLMLHEDKQFVKPMLILAVIVFLFQIITLTIPKMSEWNFIQLLILSGIIQINFHFVF